MINCRHIDTLMDPNELLASQDEPVWGGLAASKEVIIHVLIYVLVIQRLVAS